MLRRTGSSTGRSRTRGARAALVRGSLALNPVTQVIRADSPQPAHPERREASGGMSPLTNRSDPAGERHPRDGRGIRVGRGMWHRDRRRAGHVRLALVFRGSSALPCGAWQAVWGFDIHLRWDFQPAWWRLRREHQAPGHGQHDCHLPVSPGTGLGLRRLDALPSHVRLQRARCQR
jgi:hypothetical protein